MLMDSSDVPRLDDQLCFALYAASKAVAGAYRLRLREVGLTYPQYLAMLAVWERDGRTGLAISAARHRPILPRSIFRDSRRRRRSF